MLIQFHYVSLWKMRIAPGAREFTDMLRLTENVRVI